MGLYPLSEYFASVYGNELIMTKLIKLITCLKHLPGRHNQKRHGWRFGNVDAARARMADQPEEERNAYEQRVAAKIAAAKKVSLEVKLTSNAYTLSGTLENIQDGSLGGITTSYLVEVADDGKAIVKPVMSGTSFAASASNPHAEVAAYQISKLLGWDLVPETVLRQPGTYPDLRGGISDVVASSQSWVEDAQVGYNAGYEAAFKGSTLRVNERSLSRMLLFDSIIGNTDRHSGNFLVKPDGNLVAIDHGLALESNIPRVRGWPTVRSTEAASHLNALRVDQNLPIEAHPEDIQALGKLREITDYKTIMGDTYTQTQWNTIVSNADSLVAMYNAYN